MLFLIFSPCSGLILTSYSKSKQDRFFEKRMTTSINQYKKYKRLLTISDPEYKGTLTIKGTLLVQLFPVYEIKLKLKLVRISFDAATFDKITKDTSAKFVDKMSAIGGTMGLLTGFSIISGVEFFYFLIKIIIQALRKGNH